MSESVKVVCRVRPLNEREILQGNSMIVSFPSNKSISIAGRDSTFDAIFKPNSDQRQVYETTARPIIDDILNGYNGTIFAYGQTGSGKTFTMEGVSNDPVYQGITPRIIDDIFNRIYDMNENLEFEIKVSYIEIYLEHIRDLLDTTKINLSVHEGQDKRTYIRDITERFVSTPAEVFEILEDGRSTRAVGTTKMNIESSRSHSIFCIDVVQHDTENKRMLTGKLRLVDLAGSEKVSKTGAEGLTLEEAKEINKSLSCLGNVINALVEHKSHVPYRDSKLTRVLQESLGGNARTTIIICISPASSNEEESRSTIGFGVRAKKIKNKVHKNEELTGEEWRRRYEVKQELSKGLKMVVSALEGELLRWRKGEVVPQDDWLHPKDYEKLMKGDEGAEKEESAQKFVATGSAKAEQLYKELDDKDAEIARLGKCLERAKVDAQEKQKLLDASKKDLERKAGTLQQLRKETYNEQMEIKEVLEALEELAINYDQKVQGLEAKSRDMSKLEDELSQTTDDLLTKNSEIEKLKEQMDDLKKKYREIMLMLFNDMIETGEILSPNVRKPEFDCDDRPEDQATALRLYMTKLRTEAKNVATRIKLLELDTKQLGDDAQESKETLKKTTLQMQRAQAALMKTQVRLEDARAATEQAMVERDRLQTMVSTLCAQETLMKQISSGKSIDELREEMQAQLQQTSDSYISEMEKRRRATLMAQKELDNAKEEVLTLKLQLKQTEEELQLANEDTASRGVKMTALEVQAEQRDRAHQDLRGLEDTVIRELQTLHNLRKMFVTDLQKRIKKASKGASQSVENESEPEVISIAACRQKVTFLETNVQQLTQVHKQLVRDNAVLRCEVPKMEKRLLASGERVTALETALKEAKEAILCDRQRYQLEVNRIKDAMKQRNLGGRRTKHAKIMMPVKTGAH